jgi:hypothetical protein
MLSPPLPASLRAEDYRHPVLFRMLSAGGFAQFGRGPDVRLRLPSASISAAVTRTATAASSRIDHEGILIHETLTIVDELAPSFRHLIDDVIQRASRHDPTRHWVTGKADSRAASSTTTFG